MKTIGERIAELRRERGMTQEEFGASVGVSAQTVSKWENANTSPDISLLPVLSEVFGVTIDSLFSMETERESPLCRAGWEQIPETLYDFFLSTYEKVWNADGPKHGVSDPEDMRAFFAAHPEAQSGFCSEERGLVYFDGGMGMVWRGMPEDTAGLLEDEAVLGLLKALADPAVLGVLRFLTEVRPSAFTRFTAASFIKRSGLDPEDAARALAFCEKCELMFPEKIDSGEGEPLTVWTVTHAPKLRFLLGPMLALAKRFAEFRNVWWCLRG